MTINVQVVPKPNEPIEWLLKRFNKLCAKQKLLREIRDHASFTSKSEKQKLKSARHRRRLRKKRKWNG